MMSRGLLSPAGIVVVVAAVLPITAYAQVAGTGTIVGQVSDADGEPLPGVTVTVGSPALIGGEQTSVTEANRGRLYQSPSPRDLT